MHSIYLSPLRAHRMICSLHAVRSDICNCMAFHVECVVVFDLPMYFVYRALLVCAHFELKQSAVENATSTNNIKWLEFDISK